MKPEIRRAALAALSASAHRHKGIRPAGSADQEAPCKILSTSDAAGFDDAACAAQAYWPYDTEWDLVASDYSLAGGVDGMGDGIGQLGMPLTIARFSTFDGDGSAEDPGGDGDF